MQFIDSIVNWKSSMCSILSQEFQNFAAKKIYEKSNPTFDLNELLLIQQQSDFISDLMKTHTFPAKCNTLSTVISDESFESIAKKPYLNHSVSAISFCKEYSKYFQDDESSSQQVLSQIKRYCSKKTYNFIRNKLKSSQQQKQQSRLQRQIKYNQQLMQKCLKLTQEVTELKLKLASVTQKLNAQAKQKSNKISPTNLDRGQTLIKWQKSMLYKQKVQAQMKKNLNKQFNCLQEEQKLNQQLRTDLQNILIEMQQNTQIADLNKIFKFVIQNIQKQRKLTQKHEIEFFKTQKNIQQMVNEFKKGMKNNNILNYQQKQ